MKHSPALTDHQLELFGRALHECADETCQALSRWIRKPCTIRVDSVEQLPLNEATEVLGSPEQPMCFCVTDVRGWLTGHLILAFGDASGLALTDLLLDQESGTASHWGEMETSAALETANILGSAYLNALVRALPSVEGADSGLLPTPPRFLREFAESLVQFVLMEQIATESSALMARAQLHIDGEPVDWTLLLVPDARSMTALRLALK